MSYRLTHLALHTRGISATEKLVLAELADYADDAKGICWPSQRTVANLCGFSRNSVNAAIANLSKLGFIEILSHDGKPSTYRLNLPSADSPHGTESPPKHEQSEPQWLSPSVTGGCNPRLQVGVTVGYRGCNAGLQGLSPSVTQTEKKNKEDKKELKKEASDSYIPTEEDSYKPTTEENLSVCMNQPSCCLVDSFNWDEISKAAARLLVTDGFSEAEVDARVKAELEEAKWSARQRSKDGWKNLDGATIKHPQKHTIGTLANLARKTKSLPPITRDELEEVLDGDPQLAECLFCGEVTDDFWAFLVCKNFRNSQGETISRWNVQNTIRWYSEFRDDLVRRGHLRLRLGA